MIGRRVIRRRRVVRAAAVGGLAYAGGKAVQRRRDDEAAEQYAYEEEPAETQGMTSDMAAQLEQLAELKEKGILTEAEFAEQKARILGS